MTKPLALVLKGDGINCDSETVWALELAGFSAQPVHVSSFIEDKSKLKQAQLLALPGGFSFGDEIASGKVLALKLRQSIMDLLYQFIGESGLVIGICNGFQVLTQLGLLPHSQVQTRRIVTLTKNSHGHFNDRWVDLNVSRSRQSDQPDQFDRPDQINDSVKNSCKDSVKKSCKKLTSSYFAGLENIQLPMRHGEGRLVVGTSAESDSNDHSLSNFNLVQLEDEVRRLAPLRYKEDVNGSFDRIAGLTNAEGTVLGLMPHPEAFVRWTQHPSWTTLKLDRPELIEAGHPLELPQADRPHGFTILRNAFEMVS